LICGDRKKFLGNGPSEHAANSSNVLVDPFPSNPLFDHFVPNGFECQGAESQTRFMAVQFFERSEGRSDAILFAGGPAIFDVVALGLQPIGGNQFHDSEIPFFRGKKR
jgi:hypothetical protein